MKSLSEFKPPLLEEEQSDYSKFDVLVRAGLANKAQMQRIHRILDKMKEEKPVFNNSDRAILQNMFNRMVDLISNNKQIFTQARRAVHEELEEGVVDTSDYKIDRRGHKYKAHRIKFDKDFDKEIKEDTNDSPNDPPFMLLLRRKAIRLYPDKTKVALYYNNKLDRYFSLPYGPGVIGQPLQAEEVEINEAVMDQLHKIVKDRTAASVKFGNGKSSKVDGYTASAITQVHNALNDENKKKFAAMVHKSPEHFMKASAFAFKHVK
jgi:hypothetical protein